MDPTKAQTSPKKSKKSSLDEKLLETIKHYDSFYEQLPPGLIKNEEHKEKPEDVIPDRPENKAAREFLAKAPTKGLWMPLGKEVKVMKCWRCKIYGHRSGDKECPMFLSGNSKIEEFRHAHEDPMYNYVRENELQEQLKKVEMLKTLLKVSDKSNKKKKSKKHRHHHSSSKNKKESKKHSHKHNRHHHHKHKRSSSESSSSDSDSSSSSSSSSSSDSYSSDSSNSSNEKRKRKSHDKRGSSHKSKKFKDSKILINSSKKSSK